MKSYRGKYRKINGDLRQMHFIKLSDLPKKFLKEQTKGALTESNLGNGKEIVWDLQYNDFRVFNWNTVVGAVKEEEVEFVV